MTLEMTRFDALKPRTLPDAVLHLPDVDLALVWLDASPFRDFEDGAYRDRVGLLVTYQLQPGRDVDALDELMLSGRRTAKNHYGARGWVFHQNTDLWRVAAPMDGPSWGGFTTQDLKRCRFMARITALTYNWWSLFVRLAHPKARLEAITSRPLLLSGIGRLTSHAGEVHLYITPMHAKAKHAHALLPGGERETQGMEKRCGAVAFDFCLAARLRVHCDSRDRI